MEVDTEGSTEIRLAVIEELEEAEAKDSDDPRLIVLKNPVGVDSVMYATDEAFVKATTLR